MFLSVPCPSRGRKSGGVKMRKQQTSVVKFILDAMGMCRAEQAKARVEAHRLHPMGMYRISGPIGLRIARLAEALCALYISWELGQWDAAVLSDTDEKHKNCKQGEKEKFTFICKRAFWFHMIS